VLSKVGEIWVISIFPESAYNCPRQWGYINSQLLERYGGTITDAYTSAEYIPTILRILHQKLTG